MLGNAATTIPAIKKGLAKHGVAAGGRKMIDEEMLAAQLAIKTGVYITWRSKRNQQDCARVGHKSRCFCGHNFSDHRMKDRLPSCLKCKCKCFEYIPKRPEEVGDWWLVRRRGFNVHSWRAKCRCGCPHTSHDPVTKSCNSCSCGLFTSNFLCLGCDGKYEEHETTFESKEERRREGRTVGMAFKPFSEHRDIQQSIFNGGGTSNISNSMKSLTMSSSCNDNGGMSPEEMYSSGMINSDQYFQMISSSATTDNNNNNNNNNRSIVAQRNAMRAMQQKQPPISRPYNGRAERSVRLMHVSSGGQNTGNVINRWGKTDNPNAHRSSRLGNGSRNDGNNMHNNNNRRRIQNNKSKQRVIRNKKK